jgi:hypothetical protein
VKKIKITSLIVIVILAIVTLFSSVYGNEVITTEDNDDSSEETTKDSTVEANKTKETTVTEEVVEVEANSESEVIEEGQVEPSALATNEIVVSSYGDLKTALESSTNGIDTIYLGSDITMETTGITVSSTKSNVTINGSYEGVRHTLTEGKAASATSNIYINNASMNNFTLKNLDIYGYNYYGTVKVADAVSGVTLTYDNIIYNGPQITHNPYGHAVYKDTTINIQYNGTSAANEVAEVVNVDFYGTVAITHSSANNIFYFYQPSTMTFHEGSTVTVNAGSNPMFYNSTVAIVMEENAAFYYISNGPKLSNVNNSIRSMDLGKNSIFDVKLNGTTSLDYATRFSGEVIIRENANFNLTSKPTISSYLIYGTTANNWTLNGGNVNIETNSNVANVMSANKVTINSGKFIINNNGTQAIGVTLSNGITVESDGQYYQYSKQATAYSFNATGTGTGSGININGGSFHIEGGTITAQYLLGSTAPFMIGENSDVYLYAGSGPGTALVYMTATAGYIDINNPKSVLFYSPGKRVIQYTGARQFNMNASQINYWTTAALPGYQMWDPPHYYWNKQYTDDNYTINGTLAAGANGSYNITSSNYEADDGSTGNPVNQFTMSNLNVLSLGSLELSLNPISVQNTTLSGSSVPNAILLIEYNSKEVTINADENRIFSTTLSDLSVGDRINVTANNRYYLYQSADVIVEDNGGLSFRYVPETLAFHTIDIPSTPTLVQRQVDDWQIQVEDTRTTKTNWKLFVTLEQPFVDQDNKIIDNLELVFIDENDEEEKLSSQPYLVYDSNDTQELTTITWSMSQGILAKIFPGAVYRDSEYNAKVTWTLQDAP